MQQEPWPVGDIPDRVVLAIGRGLVHRLAVGTKKVSGDAFGDIFAQAVRGYHKAGSLGLGDVMLGKTVWSVKTIKSNKPHHQTSVRLVSGRASPDYSAGISDSKADVAKTGHTVLSIWNARVSEIRNEHSDVRLVVLLRNMETLAFCMFEQPIAIFPPADYSWTLNKRNNLEGHEKTDGSHVFTWQPHGAQFTIIRSVPGSARRFKVRKRPDPIDAQKILDAVGFEDSWIVIGDESTES